MSLLGDILGCGILGRDCMGHGHSDHAKKTNGLCVPAAVVVVVADAAAGAGVQAPGPVMPSGGECQSAAG